MTANSGRSLREGLWGGASGRGCGEGTREGRGGGGGGRWLSDAAARMELKQLYGKGRGCDSARFPRD